MTEIVLRVGLKIPDTTARTALVALQEMDLDINKVVREMYYKFSVEKGEETFKEQIQKVDILVNANKNSVHFDKEAQPNGVGILVKDSKPSDELKERLATSFGFENIAAVESGVLWTLDTNEQTALKAAEGLLANKHYQTFAIQK